MEMRYAMVRVLVSLILGMIICFNFAGSVLAQGESLEETLQQLSEDAARQYVLPISSAFGANLNGGWFHKVPGAIKMGLNLEVGLVAMGSSFPDDSRSFAVNGKFRFSGTEAQQLVSGQGYSPQVEDALVDQITSQTFEVGISGATVTGAEDDHILIEFPEQSFSVGGAQYTVPSQSVDLGFGGFKDLADLKLLPLASPQVSVGTVYGTQATFRYLPSVTLNGDLGTLKYFGYGIQHNPGVWLKDPLPVDIALSFFTQNLKVGELFKANATAYGLNVSKRFGTVILNITPYAGFMFENADMEVTYNYIVDTPAGQYSEEVNFKLDSENKNRLVLGLSLRLLAFNLNVDYNASKYKSYTMGLTFGL
jgi:hypothetical protein